jgi:hypothetical protein
MLPCSPYRAASTQPICHSQHGVYVVCTRSSSPYQKKASMSRQHLIGPLVSLSTDRHDNDDKSALIWNSISEHMTQGPHHTSPEQEIACRRLGLPCGGVSCVRRTLHACYILSDSGEMEMLRPHTHSPVIAHVYCPIGDWGQNDHLFPARCTSLRLDSTVRRNRPPAYICQYILCNNISVQGWTAYRADGEASAG